jgi:cytidylate kinase
MEPVILCLGGTAGVGKSTVARAVTTRLGVAHHLATGYLRETLRLMDADQADVRLLTNNPRKIQVLQEAGIGVVVVPLIITATAESQAYLATKWDTFGVLDGLSTHEMNCYG